MIESEAGVTILGAGSARREDIADALSLAPCLVAADGGAAIALECGFPLRAVVGDMDSLDGRVADRIPASARFPVSEQESTDFDKCLRVVDAPFVVALGVTTPRLDHGLASLNAIIRHRRRPVLIITDADVCFHAPPRVRLALGKGARVSLFPMRNTAGRSEGLEWPIDGIEFSPSGRTGTSNRASQDEIALEFSAPGMLVLLEKRNLAKAAACLSRAPHWPESSG